MPKRASRAPSLRDVVRSCAFQVLNFEFVIWNLFGILNLGFRISADLGQRSAVLQSNHQKDENHQIDCVRGKAQLAGNTGQKQQRVTEIHSQQNGDKTDQ